MVRRRSSSVEPTLEPWDRPPSCNALTGELSRRFEVSAAAQLIEEAAHDEANIIFGTVIDDALGDEVRVTVIAAGFDGGQPQKRQARPVEQRQGQPSRPSSQPPASNAPQVSPMPGQRPAPAAQPSPRPMDDDDLDVPDFMK